eukprot:2471045-Pyramimonas_sp.AAC.1
MAIAVIRQAVVTIDGGCAWRVSNEVVVDDTAFGEVDVHRKVDTRAAARPPARSGSHILYIDPATDASATADARAGWVGLGGVKVSLHAVAYA